MKGDGEAHPMLSPTTSSPTTRPGTAATSTERAQEARDAPVRVRPRGAQARPEARERARGEPVQVRHVGGTDTHTALATAAEENFFGKHRRQEPNPDRWKEIFLLTEQVRTYDWQMTASGWTGVWATENTREAIWDAMKRKEAYATTGPRMLVRFFGGCDFEQADAQRVCRRTPATTRACPWAAICASARRQSRRPSWWLP